MYSPRHLVFQCRFKKDTFRFTPVYCHMTLNFSNIAILTTAPATLKKSEWLSISWKKHGTGKEGRKRNHAIFQLSYIAQRWVNDPHIRKDLRNKIQINTPRLFQAGWNRHKIIISTKRHKFGSSEIVYFIAKHEKIHLQDSYQLLFCNYVLREIHISLVNRLACRQIWRN